MFWIHRNKPHRARQKLDPPWVDPHASSVQLVSDPADGQKGALHIDLVDPLPRTQIRLRGLLRPVANLGWGDPEEFTLPFDRERMRPVDDASALLKINRPSVEDRKSGSMVSSPIFAWSASISRGSFVGPLPLSKIFCPLVLESVLPELDPAGMDPKVFPQLRRTPVSSQGRQGYLRFECRRVVPSRVLHLLLNLSLEFTAGVST